MAHWTEEYLAMIVDCERGQLSLTDRESEFTASLRRQLERGATPSARQIEYLEDIWPKATAPNRSI